MILKNDPVFLKGNDGPVEIKRNSCGSPDIKAVSWRDGAYGMGWVHANDRQLQMMITRTVLQGRSAELLADDPDLAEADMYIKGLNLYPDVDGQIEKLDASALEMAQAYTEGVNDFLASSKRLFEFRILGYRPEPWAVEDTMMLAKVFSFFGLTDVQGNMEKLLVQMVQNDIDEKRIKELFPYLTEKPDAELLKKVKLSPPMVPGAVRWLSLIPRFTGSNNWAVSGGRTRSGSPILCGDPHLEVNRMPAIWHQSSLHLPDQDVSGFALPGVPALIFGRNRNIAYSPTYSFMDMIDFRIEECRDGKYRRGRRWVPFDVRTVTVKTKKGREIRQSFYENEHGILEGDPSEDGFYLVRSWSAAKDCGAEELNTVCGIMKAGTVRQAMKLYRNLEAASFNFVIADRSGNIGYQMSGRLFRRPKGVSGLIPLPGWEKKYDSRGFVPSGRLPSSYNPPEGMIVTANQDLNHMGTSKPINLPMAPYRAQRIEKMLSARKKLDIEYMKDIQYDLYSVQAEKLMKVIKPLLPDTKKGRILKQWDLKYSADSVGATLFEGIYRAMLMIIFGDNGMGREAVAHLLDETSIFNDYFGNFDNIILSRKSHWFRTGSRDDLFRMAVHEGLQCRPVPYGCTRMIKFRHLLFGGKVPSFFGFDQGPLSLPGSRGTVLQGQIFRSAGRETTFSPSARVIADMSESSLHVNMPGGACDRRFSGLYSNFMEGWLNGEYTELP